MQAADRGVLRTALDRGATIALALAALALVLGATAVFSGAYQVRPVLSSSMTPHLPVGAVVITHRVPVSAVRAQDVIVFHDPYDTDKLVVHRVQDVTRDGGATIVRTKGDANASPDPWAVSLLGADSYRAIGAVPYVGYLALWLHQSVIQRLLVPAGLGLGVVAVALVAWPRRRSDVGAPTDVATA